METAISRALAIGLAGLALPFAGCGAGGEIAGGRPPDRSGSVPAGSHASAGTPPPGVAAAFAWLRRRSVPAGWHVATIPTGAALAYPRSWRPYPGDPGTATAALLGDGGRIRGYLNITPRQGPEALATWASFRIAHNAEEGDREVRREGAAGDLAFRRGKGSCVRDSYTTTTGARYVELACLVAGAQASTVIVAAALRSAWRSLAPELERAISAFAA
jgi:hypothetical protein